MHGWPGLIGTRDLLDQLMTTRGPLRVLFHDLAEELGDVIQACVLCIADVLAVIMPRLKGVILNRDQVERHVIEAGFPSSHRRPPSRSRCLRCYPDSAPQTTRRRFHRS